MRYVARMTALAGVLAVLAALAGCGSSTSSAPDQETPGLRSVLGAGRTLSTEMTGSGTASSVIGLSVTPDGTRLALQYGDGHVVVWAVLGHKKLLTVPAPAPPLEGQSIWLTGGGATLVRQVGTIAGQDEVLQLWQVNHPGAVSHFNLGADWAWEDPTQSHLLLLPGFNETCPGFPAACHGLAGLLWLDLPQSRLLASAPPPASLPFIDPAGKAEAQPPGLAPEGLAYDQADGTFVIAADAQDGFVTWKPGSPTVTTNAHCLNDETVATDGQLFACISTTADALTLWNVATRRMIRQMLLPDYVADNQQITIAAVSFADDDSMLAVAIARQSQSDLIRIYRTSDFQLAQTFTLGPSAGQNRLIRLWPAGRSLVAEQWSGPWSAGFYAFPFAG